MDEGQRYGRDVALQSARFDGTQHSDHLVTRDLINHLHRAAEEERSSVARELHDELGALLIAAKSDVSWLRQSLASAAQPPDARWQRAVQTLEQSISVNRHAIERLHPSLLDTMGLAPALHWLATESLGSKAVQLDEYYADNIPNLAAEAGITLFRLVEATLKEILRDVGTTRVTVELTFDAEHRQLQIVVRADGSVCSNHHAGISSLELAALGEQISALGGDLTVGPNDKGCGLRVIAWLPQREA